MKLKHILLAIGILVVDLFVYLVLAMLLMNYEDNYQPSQGPFWSLESMTGHQQILYLSWIAWKVINLAVIGYVVYRLIKRFSAKTI